MSNTPDDKQAWEGPDTDLNKAYDAGRWGLQSCAKCELMTNHDDSGCLRCKKVEVSTDNACKNNQTPDEFLDEVLSGFAMHAAWWGFDKALDTPKRHTTSSRTESLNITKQRIKDYYASEVSRATTKELPTNTHGSWTIREDGTMVLMSLDGQQRLRAEGEK